MWDFLSEIEGPLGALLIIGAAIFLVIRTLKRYILVRDRFKLDVLNCCVIINKERILFEEIDFVRVRELEQPSELEKAFSKEASNVYMAQIVFHLKNDYEVVCKFNDKGTLYYALKQLVSYVQVNGNIEDYKNNKPQVNWGVFVYF